MVGNMKHAHHNLLGSMFRGLRSMVPPWLLWLIALLEIGTSAEACLCSLVGVACSTGVVDCGLWLRISKQFLSCALVRRREVVFVHCYKSIATSAGPYFRDVAFVPFECMVLDLEMIALHGIFPFCYLCKQCETIFCSVAVGNLSV